MIGLPQNFRQISSIIDVDILPETHRRVRLHKHGTHKPLGFYIRDGVSVRVTPQGVEKVRSIISCQPTSLLDNIAPYKVTIPLQLIECIISDFFKTFLEIFRMHKQREKGGTS